MKMKKFITPVLAASLAFGGFAMSANAQDNIANLTLDDGRDFTIVKEIGEKEDIMVKGLTSSWTKVDITDTSKIVWTTSNPDVVKFKNGRKKVDSITGTDNVNIQTVGEGRAEITATYDGKTINSNVVVEGNEIDSQDNGIVVTVDGINSEDFSETVDVKLFSLKDIYGESFDNSDVLKNEPTAIHALLTALENHYSDDGIDWNWVEDNVTIESEGSFIKIIAKDSNDYTNGWQYTVNSEKFKESSSIHGLEDKDNVKWEFKKWEF